MKVGIPKAMVDYEYPVLFEKFFENLGIEIIYSDNTNSQILEDGINYSVDEACLASKIYLGHVYNLIKKSKEEKIDYIFIPRICSFKGNETVCVKFYAMYDICKNVFDFNFITLNIDLKKKQNELKSFLNLGKKLNIGYIKTLRAYRKAKIYEKQYNRKIVDSEKNRLKESKNTPNILIVSHPYVVYDEHLGKPITKFLENLGANVFYSNINDSIIDKGYQNNYKKFSNTLYWKFSKNLLNGINDYIDNMDGIIYLSAFPCGLDCLVTELTIRKLNDLPCINILLDEQDAQGAGIYTRLESFYDILEERKSRKKVLS